MKPIVYQLWRVIELKYFEEVAVPNDNSDKYKVVEIFMKQLNLNLRLLRFKAIILCFFLTFHLENIRGGSQFQIKPVVYNYCRYTQRIAFCRSFELPH
jgi:hypothetical protein